MSANARRAVLVGGAALLGIVIAVALAILTSHLTTQHVGLAGEPLRPKSGLVSRPPSRTEPTTSTGTSVPAQTDQGESEQGDD